MLVAGGALRDPGLEETYFGSSFLRVASLSVKDGRCSVSLCRAAVKGQLGTPQAWPGVGLANAGVAWGDPSKVVTSVHFRLSELMGRWPDPLGLLRETGNPSLDCQGGWFYKLGSD